MLQILLFLYLLSIVFLYDRIKFGMGIRVIADWNLVILLHLGSLKDFRLSPLTL